MPEGKKEIGFRLTIVYILLILVWAIAIIFQIVRIQYIEGSFWRKKANARTFRPIDIQGQRGTIYSSDGKLLATSLPIYNVYIDLNSKPRGTEYIIPNNFFSSDSAEYRYLQVLCDSLAKVFPDKSAGYYKTLLKTGRKQNKRCLLIRKGVSIAELERMKRFPILSNENLIKKKKGNTKKPKPKSYQFCNAVIVSQGEKRENPFGENLARRTIGIQDKKNGCDTCFDGLEGAYNTYLKGIKGKVMAERLTQSLWRPLANQGKKQAEDGKDIVSTIDSRVQELAENSLRKCLDSNDAEAGCAILMEVSTGYVRAITSLKQTSSGGYKEIENIAVNGRYQPGSTFKTITAMVLLENNICDTSIKVPTGERKFAGELISDVNKKDYGMVSLTRAFEVSSNVGICTPVFNAYNNQRKEFLNKMKQTFPFSPLNLDIIDKEPKPTAPNELSSTRDFMTFCFGYCTSMTPLQLLTFYNAIANKGKMLKPLFISDIKQAGETIKHIEPVVIKEHICSDKTLEKIDALLKSVVQNGSARRLSKTPYGIAGKTGTAKEIKNGNIDYRASFVGYFPADKPLYSCMVLVINPKKGIIHGGELAAPVFKEIADRVCGTRLDLEIPSLAKNEKKQPPFQKGAQADIKTIFSTLNIPYLNGNSSQKWVYPSYNENDSLNYGSVNLQKNIVPSVKGMTLKDALYLLEDMGLKVNYSGYGKVTSQSLSQGTPFKRGNSIYLALSTGSNSVQPMVRVERKTAETNPNKKATENKSDTKIESKKKQESIQKEKSKDSKTPISTQKEKPKAKTSKTK